MECSMPRANCKSITPAETTSPALTNIDSAALPDQYGMRVMGNCMLPQIAHGDLLYFDKREAVHPGDTVIIFLRPEIVEPARCQATVKRLVTAIPDWVT